VGDSTALVAYPPWVIRRVVACARSGVVERLLLDGSGIALGPGTAHADAFEEWLVERTLRAARSEEYRQSVEYEHLRSEWERGR
jgi:hypothetical protein